MTQQNEQPKSANETETPKVPERMGVITISYRPEGDNLELGTTGSLTVEEVIQALSTTIVSLSVQTIGKLINQMEQQNTIIEALKEETGEPKNASDG